MLPGPGKIYRPTTALSARLVLLFTLLFLLDGHSAFGVKNTRAVDHDSLAVEISFATNRNRIDTDDIAQTFGDEAGPLSFGTCAVQFTPIKVLQSAARHISLRFPTEIEDIADLRLLEEEEFWPRLQKQVDIQGRKFVFYIHGYKMDFAKSCRRAALMQRELGPDVTLLLFAWPSQDNFALYARDETMLKKSVGDIKHLLNRILATFGHGRTNVVGHSLGTRGINAAIADLAPQDQPLFDQLVLVAPDMDRPGFESTLPELSRAVTGITIYVSDNDGPLRVSREVHGEPRLGEAGETLMLFEGIETIDVSEVPQRDIYGHNYHYFNERVIADLRHLLTEGARAAERPRLSEQKKNGRTYWKMLE